MREEAEPMPKRSRRPGETEQQAVTRRERNNEHMTVVRNNETVEQRSVRLESKRASRANADARRRQATSNLAVADGIDESQVALHYLGKFEENCTFCNAKYFHSERNTAGEYNVCCNKGQVRISNFSTNYYINKLMMGDDPDSKHFMENIRSYNSAFGICICIRWSSDPGTTRIWTILF